MIKFNNINFTDGKQLLEDLAQAGVILNIETQAPLIDSDGFLCLDVEENQREIVQSVLDSHVPKDTQVEKQTARQALLDKLGITEDEAKLLLGGN
jgi:hypothetical protein